MKCYLVRHGQTEWNQSHRFQGWLDIGLDQIGILQSQMLARYFSQIPIDYIFSSDLSRALKTAQQINQKLDCRMTLSSGLREMNVGNWEGKTWEEIEVEFKDDLNQDDAQLFGLTISGGESLLGFQKRVVETFMRIIEKHPNNELLIVTHGGVIRVLLCHLLGYDLSQRDLLKVENGSITTLDVLDKNHIEIVAQNIIKHLSS
ncbi:MAG: histidine phosphatase family protein [Firmicutes bacterium]|nr:histidine phosphatase family protein [Bacillota bacterium]